MLAYPTKGHILGGVRAGAVRSSRGGVHARSKNWKEIKALACSVGE